MNLNLCVCVIEVELYPHSVAIDYYSLSSVAVLKWLSCAASQVALDEYGADDYVNPRIWKKVGSSKICYYLKQCDGD